MKYPLNHIIGGVNEGFSRWGGGGGQFGLDQILQLCSSL